MLVLIFAQIDQGTLFIVKLTQGFKLVKTSLFVLPKKVQVDCEHYYYVLDTSQSYSIAMNPVFGRVLYIYYYPKPNAVKNYLPLFRFDFTQFNGFVVLVQKSLLKQSILMIQFILTSIYLFLFLLSQLFIMVQLIVNQLTASDWTGN